MNSGQTYATHAYRPTAWNIVWLICLVAVLLSIWVAVRDRTLVAHVLLLLSVGVLGTISLVRVFALRLQNRIIRLEMQVRLARLGLDGTLGRLTTRQLVALRFASDAELPSLLQRAISENLSSDDIKRAVKDWQGDYWRT
jgi:hypothetical protein